MDTFHLAIVIGLVYLSGVLLALATAPFVGHYGLARVVTPIVVVLVCLCLEHVVALTPTPALGTVVLLILAGLAIRNRGLTLLRRHWKTEAAFLIGFGYCFLWRWAFPSIDASSERLADLSFICTYMQGTTLPPLDLWLPPEPLNVYYSLQHYAAALLGRTVGLQPGVAYHLSYCLLVGLSTTAAACAIAQFCAKLSHRLLVLSAFLIGGTGVSFLIPFMSGTAPPLHASMRFIGNYANQSWNPTPFGRWIASLGLPQGPDLPVELFSYTVSLGDYHASLSGFLLLALALLCIGVIERTLGASPSKALPWVYGVLVATVPVALVAHTWVVPLQALLIGLWIWHPLRQHPPPNGLKILAVVGVTLALLAPFLWHFVPNMTHSQSGLAWVLAEDRPSPWHWLMVHWPVLALIVLGVRTRSPDRRGPRWALVWALSLFFAELACVDDVYVGKFNRFNTSLKWMPWIHAGALLSLGPVCLAHGSRLIRRVTLLVLGALLTYGLSLGQQFLRAPKPFAGRLEGHAWLTADPAQRALIEQMARLPDGVVLEYPRGEAFASSPAMTMAARKPAFIGWSWHERLWRGVHRQDIQRRYEDARQFYTGQLADPLAWLMTRQIRYVLWLKEQNQQPDAFERIDQAIRPVYEWFETYRAGAFRVGMWIRRDPSHG